MKTVVGTVLEIALNTQVKKKDGGTYPGWQLTYRNSDGKIEDIAKHANTFKYQPQLKASLEALSKDDTFTMELEKGQSGFWEVVSISKGDAMPAQTAVRKPAYRSDNSEADKTRQTSIVRQSSLKSAVEALGPGKKAADYIALAKTFEEYASGVDKGEAAEVQ